MNISDYKPGTQWGSLSLDDARKLVVILAALSSKNIRFEAQPPKSSQWILPRIFRRIIGIYAPVIHKRKT
jgi:hypothetical protein